MICSYQGLQASLDHIFAGQLDRSGASGIALDNLITRAPQNISHLLSRAGFSYVELDVCGPLANERPVDRVFHLASLASPVDYLNHPLETLESGSTERADAGLARQHGARFLLTSTSECYGDPLEHPQAETYWGNVNPVGLRSCYDERSATQRRSQWRIAAHTIRTNIARIFNTYGPRMA